MSDNYVPTIGIECHVQLKTKTKLFAAVANDARGALPNTLVSHICFGMPGALPVLNEHAITLAIRAAFALKTNPEKFSKFDRKHYFYPDLPKGYQISQFNHPIIAGGEVDILVDGQLKTIAVTRAHLEEDAGKSTHPAGKDYSLVDLNRAGTPLLEIVSEPEIHSASEARAYAHELYLLMKYADVTDGDLYHGHMRFDVNVSVSKDPKVLGTRTETKNLNSFKSVEKAVEYEIKRQCEVLEKGGTIVQQTRGWDDAKQKTFNQRDKEEAHDYRYFPDPDIPPVVLSEDKIQQTEKEMPTLPSEWRAKLQKVGLEFAQIETLLDIHNEFSEANYLDLLDKSISNSKAARNLANWFINDDAPFVREKNISHQIDREKLYNGLLKLVSEAKLSSTKSKELLFDIISSGQVPDCIEEYAKEKCYIQLSDESAIANVVKEVIESNPTAAEDVKNGEMKAIGFLVGQVMKQSKGRANPGLAQQLIKKQLGV